jgi:glyoxylase I family protein
MVDRAHSRYGRFMERVSGIGGFFFTASDATALADWYARHLGITPVPTDYGQAPWRQQSGPTAFAPMPRPDDPAQSEFFWRPQQTFALNLRVDDLAAMVSQLRSAGIEVAVDPQPYPIGTFAALRDPEGNPIQLWQPQDPSDAGGEGDSLEGALAAERETLDPQARRDSARMAALLADGFSEIGASGRVWTREDVLAAVASESQADDRDPLDLRATWLAPGLAQVTYRSGGPTPSLRSSLWRWDGRWQLVFHQGTSATDGA